MYSEQDFQKQVPSNEMLRSVLSFFSFLWVLTGVGVVLGQFVPPEMMIPLIILELVLIVVMVFSRKAKRIGRPLAMAFAFISGITLYPTLLYYVGDIGGEVVLAVFVSTAVVFAAYGFVGYRLNKNLVGWSSYLFVALIALVVIMIFGFFIPFTSTFSLIISMGAVLLFSLYTIYDFNQIRHQPMTRDDIPLMAVKLYLDFLNLFLHLLRIVSIFSRD